ncbi:ZIP family metal transporter [Candidatus Saccharibacteria bacterium]|nr:ZIP family metal transporter [Candidatus Saccharibacteria bacterium]
MLEIGLIVGITILTAFVSLAGGFALLTDSKIARGFQKFSMVFAVAVLLYAVFGDILPEVFEDGDLPEWLVLLYVCLGIGICELISVLAAHFHRHGDDEKVLKNQRQATAMLIVDSIHTAMDGIVIGTSFAAGLGTGIISSVATAAHEIPQEIGDFAIMQRSGMKRKRIVKLQILSALILTPFAVLAYFVGDKVLPALPTLMSFVAGFFLYIVIGEVITLIQWLLGKKGGKHAKNH